MAILWCGGEDIDFTHGAPVVVNALNSYRRTAYSRYAISVNSTNAIAQSTPFPGGEITSGWFSFQYYQSALVNSFTKIFAFGKSTTSKGIFMGCSSTNASKACLYKYDGTTLTLLASENGTNLVATTIRKFDMQLINYGSNATVRLYADGVQIIEYTGDITIPGINGIDCVLFSANVSGSSGYFSEVIVATTDTRSYSLATMYPSGTGTYSDWAGTYADVDESTMSNADIVSATTADLVSTFQMSNLPAGNDKIVGIAVKARASCGETGPQNLQMAAYSDSSLIVSSSIPLSTGPITAEKIWDTNPNTGQRWTRSEADAIELGVKSIT